MSTPGQLLKELFDGHWIAWTQNGIERIPPPVWLKWPSHTAAEMGPPPVAHAELAKQSRGRRK